MRHVALSLLLTGIALADDGAWAPPTRWSHARGAAACNGLSRAQPPESFGRIAWTYKAKDAVLFTPVVWDGAIFLVDGSDKKADLVALDVETGQVWARTAVKSPGQPAVYQRSVFLVEEGKTLVQIRLAGHAFVREWTYDAGPGASSPRVIDGEISLVTSAALLSLRPGLSRPAWKVDGSFTGEPAVRDGHVYALRRDGAKVVVSAYARSDGKEATSVVVRETAPAGAGGRIAVGARIVGVLLPPEQDRSWALLSRDGTEGKADLKLIRTEKLLTDPMAGQFVIIALAAEPRAWTIYYSDEKQPAQPLVTAADRPELCESPRGCIWLGEACQCYGDWCGDLNSNVVYWHAMERPEGAPLRKGLRCDAVPARDELLLLVPADGKSVLALAPEEIR